jgi:hypothetical protein
LLGPTSGEFVEHFVVELLVGFFASHQQKDVAADEFVYDLKVDVFKQILIKLRTDFLDVISDNNPILLYFKRKMWKDAKLKFYWFLEISKKLQPM